MCAATSSPSLYQSPNLNPDDWSFDGGAGLLAAFRRGMKPDQLLSVTEWADEHRFLAAKAAAEPGRYRSARTPYLREIMNALSPAHHAQRVTFMKGAQVGATEAGNNWIGFVIHHAPGPMLAVLPNVELAKRNSRSRIDPLIEESPVLRELVKPARSRDAGNTMLSKDFPGGILVMTGANSAVGLRSMPARYLFLDEVDGFPTSSDDEGDPVALAEARTSTFSHRRKIFMVSTPTVRGVSRIEREFEASDQRRYFVPCPHCGEMQWLEFERLRWEKGRPETAAYLCIACEAPIDEHHKTRFLEQGEWRPTAISSDPKHVGFQISALYSPIGWESWQNIARKKEAAKGSDAAQRAFANTVLGISWTESGDAPEWERLQDRRENYGSADIPARGLFLTAGVDVQADRFEIDVWAWGRDLESWLIDHRVIEGGPKRPAAWDELTTVLGASWQHENGAFMQIAKLAIDTGYETSAVYGWSRKQGFAQVAPVKGVEGFNRSAPVSGPTFVDATIGGKRLRRGARLWTVAVSTFKQETYRFLRLERPPDEQLAAGGGWPPGYVHLPDWADTEWMKQLVAEQLVTVRNRRGIGRLEWQKMRERNEALDLRVYARAAAWILGADRWSEDAWRTLESQAGVETLEKVEDPKNIGQVAPTAGLLMTPRRSRKRAR